MKKLELNPVNKIGIAQVAPVYSFKSPLSKKPYSVQLEFGKYANGRMAIEMIDVKDGDSVAVATVNIPESQISDNHVIIKDWSENEGVLSFLQLNNIVGPVLYRINTGYVKADVCELLIEAK